MRRRAKIGKKREEEEKIANNKVTRFPVNAKNDELQNSFGNLYLAFNRFVHIVVYAQNSLHCHPSSPLSYPFFHPYERPLTLSLVRSLIASTISQFIKYKVCI